MATLRASYAVGWNANEQTHNAARIKNAILGDSLGYLMNGGDADTRRFAATVLDAIGFADGALGEREANKGGAAIRSTMNAGDIDYIHRKYKGEIYSKHLAKPFMGDEEFYGYILDDLLGDAPAYKDLLTKAVEKTFRMRV